MANSVDPDQRYVASDLSSVSSGMLPSKHKTSPQRDVVVGRPNSSGKYDLGFRFICGRLYEPRQAITETCLYNFDTLKPHFYLVKLGFRGVYIIFLISAQKHRLWHSLEPPRRGGSNEYPQSMFRAEIWKISEIFIWKFSVFGGEIFYIFE